MRADAQRNRERLIEVAHAVFKERGLDAPLDEVARRAGVGPGTLYRHFPTREALHEAIMATWIEEVSAHVEKAIAVTTSADTPTLWQMFRAEAGSKS